MRLLIENFTASNTKSFRLNFCVLSEPNHALRYHLLLRNNLFPNRPSIVPSFVLRMRELLRGSFIVDDNFHLRFLLDLSLWSTSELHILRPFRGFFLNYTKRKKNPTCCPQCIRKVHFKYSYTVKINNFWVKKYIYSLQTWNFIIIISYHYHYFYYKNWAKKCFSQIVL